MFVSSCTRLSLVLLLSAIFFGINFSNLYSNTPNWVNSSSVKYSDNVYLSEVGSGTSREEAINKAYSRIVEIFGVSIKSRDVSQASSRTSGRQTSYDAYTASSVDVSSQHDFFNIEIKETHYDRSTKTHYALAVVHRKNTSNIIENKIRDNTRTINQYLSSAENIDDPLFKYSTIKKAIPIAKDNEMLANQFHVLSLYEKQLEHQSSSAIEQKAKELLRSISFFIDTDDKNLKNIIANSLKKMNLKTIENRYQASYIIEEERTFYESDMTNLYSTYLVEYNCSINIINSYGDSMSIDYLCNGKTVGGDRNAAMRDVSRLTTEYAKSNFETLFLEFLNKY